MNEAYQTLYSLVLPVLGVAMVCCLLRAILGPRVADRVIAVNMTGSLAIIAVCILAFTMDEGYLTDVALVYAMLSFLAVVLLTKIYMGVYLGRKQHEKSLREKEERS